MAQGRSPAGLIPIVFALIIRLFLCPPVPLYAVAANDTLLPGRSIKDDGGDLLVSARGDFALGFFSPANTTNRYVGIWYHNIPGNDVVWVANRDGPIPNRSGAFTLNADGTLVVSDQRNTRLWSSSNSTGPVASSIFARLLDTGNLVVTDGSSSNPVLWQMFDHPADTFLPGMHVGLDMTTGVLKGWTSWLSPHDPAPGRFFAAVDPLATPQALLWERHPNGTRGRPLWRSGQWNGALFTGIYNMKTYNLYGFRFSNPSQEKKLYFTYTPFNNNTYVRLRLLPGGTEIQYNFTRGADSKWLTFWEQPLTACEVYNSCGSNAICLEDQERRRTQQKPARCECWKGFQPRVPEEWKRGVWTGGCVRRTPLVCNTSVVEGRDYGFWKVGGLKLPDSSLWVADLDAKGCRDACGANCTCVAYGSVDGIGCMHWGGDLDDVHTMPPLANDVPPLGNDVYLKLAQSELLDAAESKKKSSKAYVIGIVLGSVFFLACLLALMFKYRSRKREINKEQKVAFSVMNNDKQQKQGDMADLPLFSFDDMAGTTNNFSESNLLGKGGFGPVYKGMINGQEVAVKRLSKDSGQGVEQFKNEVILIAQLQHRSLVRLLGCCVQEEEKILVYEFMPNKSLDVFLFEPKNRALLDWKMRLDIIEGIARGLLYLHHDSRLRIVHRDLKASNILLDKEMQPKISDFGMARIFDGNRNQANTNRVVGTYGYMAPEYAMDGLFSIKSDVYSFGVLVLEIVSGKKNQFALDYGPFTNLLGQAWHLWDDGRALELVDPEVSSSLRPDEALKCINIGLLCVQDRAADRPSMSTVLVMLGSENITCPAPKQPTFTTDRSNDVTDSSTGRSNGSASTDVTITVITGR